MFKLRGAKSTATATALPDVDAYNVLDAEEVLGLVGMSNLGNTCYANSVLQALHSHKLFREAVAAQFESEKAVTPAAESSPPPVLQPLSSSTGTTKARPKSSSSGTSAGRATLAAAFNRRPPSSGNVTADTAAEASSTRTSTSAADEAPAPPLPQPAADATLLSTLSDLFDAVKAQPKKQGYVAPTAFIQQLRRENELFRSTMHQDAHEFLGYLLNAVAEDVQTRAKADPTAKFKLPGLTDMTPVDHFSEEPATWVHSLFEGVLTNETRCLTCETVTSRDESFLDLSIDIDENTSITACLRQFSASEMLSHTNKFSCDTCWGLQEAEKRMKIKKLPNVLALHLKRFKYQEESQRFIKLTYRVVFPLELRLFNTVDSSPDPDRLYSLWAIVVHIGIGPHAGHYVTIVRGTAGKWLLFDDENVTEIDESDLPKYYGDTPGMGSGYVLFYETVPQNDGPTAPLVHLAHRQRHVPVPPPQPSPIPVPLATPLHGSFDLPPLSPSDQTPTVSTQPSGSGLNRLFTLSRKANGLASPPPITTAVPPVPPLPVFPPGPLSPRAALEVLADPERGEASDAASTAPSEGDRRSSTGLTGDSPPFSRAGYEEATRQAESSDGVSVSSSQPPPSPVVSKDGGGRFQRFLRPKAKWSTSSSASIPTVAAVAPLSPPQTLKQSLSMSEDLDEKKASRRSIIGVRR